MTNNGLQGHIAYIHLPVTRMDESLAWYERKQAVGFRTTRIEELHRLMKEGGVPLERSERKFVSDA